MASKSELCQEYAEILKKLQECKENLATKEIDIYNIEGSYLEETQQNGNIVRGWNDCLYTSKPTNNKAGGRKFKESERVFSSSSDTSNASVFGTTESRKKESNNSVGGSGKKEKDSTKKKSLKRKLKMNDFDDNEVILPSKAYSKELLTPVRRKNSAGSNAGTASATKEKKRKKIKSEK